ncbi:hypothetical protein JCM8097_007805 [Rhodosporidiobolus ruineniae]
MQPSHGASHPLAGVGYSPHPPLPSSATTAHGQVGTSQGYDSHSHSPLQHTSHSGALGGAGRPGSGSGQGGAGSSAATGKKASSKRQSVAPPDEDDDEPSKKRSKQSLSCGECKRRKIKCDRKIPCSSCIKRGAADQCNWEDAKIEPEKQPFALVNDVDELRERLSLLERFLNTLPQPLKIGMRELGIKHFGTRPKNDIKAEQITIDELAAVDQHLQKVVHGQTIDSLGVLDSVIFGRDKTFSASGEGPSGQLTAALTCIVAPKIVYVDPASSTNIGLDLCFSQAELDNERLRTLEKIYRLLPARQVCASLIQSYYSHFEWFFALLHHSTFDAEVVAFWEMVDSGRKYEVDPAWLALFYLVLALASDNSIHLSFDSPSEFDTGAWYNRGDQLHAAAQKLLLLADAFGTPQVRVIQCIILLACWTVISSHGGEYGRFSSWLACGIRAGQKLGLHRLTDDPEHMPPDDPAWPPGKNSIKREGALRIWSFLTFFDHIAASARFKAYMIHPAHTTTPLPSNVNGNELSATDWRITPSPPSVLTDASLEIHKYHMARISRKTFDYLVAAGTAFNYGKIMEIDREYRELLDSMPDNFRQEYSALEEKDPIIRGKRYIALQGVHNRIVRLHRPFLVKGWTSPKFAYSTEACIKSAKVVLVSHHNNHDVNRNLRMMYSHSLSAAIVLAADLFHAISIDASETETESKKEVLAMALEVFSEEIQNKVQSNHLKVIIESARRVLTGLFLEAEKRRVRRAAHAGTSDGPINEKPFAEILQALARTVDGATLPRPGEPVSQPSNGAVILSPAPQQQQDPTTQLADPLGGAFGVGTYTLDPSFPVSYPGNPSEPVNNSLTSGLLQDLGLISYSNGQQFDYWTQTQLAMPDLMQQNGSAPGSSSGTVPAAGSAESTSPQDLAAFLGVGAPGTADQAAQVLLQQMVHGW